MNLSANDYKRQRESLLGSSEREIRTTVKEIQSLIKKDITLLLIIRHVVSEIYFL